MSYDNYKVWLRGMNNTELNEELKRLLKNVREAKTVQAERAWSQMYDTAVAEMYRRDT